MKVKVSVMTNKSYPKYKAVKKIIDVDCTATSYYWEFKDIEKMFKDSDDEYPSALIIREVKEND